MMSVVSTDVLDTGQQVVQKLKRQKGKEKWPQINFWSHDMKLIVGQGQA